MSSSVLTFAFQGLEVVRVTHTVAVGVDVVGSLDLRVVGLKVFLVAYAVSVGIHGLRFWLDSRSVGVRGRGVGRGGHWVLASAADGCHDVRK